MWASFFFVLFVATGVAFIIVYRRQSEQLVLLERARTEIELEEKRVFEFLHGLGEAFSESVHLDDLHRMLVESAMRILDAQGGALYLHDRERGVLLPRFISKSAPPLVEVPPHILQQMESTPQALQSYLRLHAVKPGEGAVGTVWIENEPLFLTGTDERLYRLRDTTLRTEAAMLCPLSYARERLGVLAISNGPMSSPFTDSDFAVFTAITEQAAFALYNAMIYSEAGEKRRMDTDMQLAQDIQRILLPAEPPRIDGFDISGINIPARQVSGDYFDYIKLDDHRQGIAIADVSGKGVPASLIMAMCRSVLRSQAGSHPSAAEVLHRVNRQLFPDIKEDMFISMAYAVVDSTSNCVTLCRAGHDAPLFYSAREQVVSKINPPGMAIGIDTGDVFDRITRDCPVTLESGDCLILYTDGVTEALDGKGREFGMKRVIQSIQVTAPKGAGAVVKGLTEDLRSFIGNNPQNDDITLIVIHRK